MVLDISYSNSTRSEITKIVLVQAINCQRNNFYFILLLGGVGGTGTKRKESFPLKEKNEFKPKDSTKSGSAVERHNKPRPRQTEWHSLGNEGINDGRKGSRANQTQNYLNNQRGRASTSSTKQEPYSNSYGHKYGGSQQHKKSPTVDQFMKAYNNAIERLPEDVIRLKKELLNCEIEMENVKPRIGYEFVTPEIQRLLSEHSLKLLKTVSLKFIVRLLYCTH